MTKKLDNLIALKFLAQQLDVNLESNHVAVCTPEMGAIARTHDHSLEAKVSSKGIVYIDSQKSPGIKIELVDHTKEEDISVPEGAVYKIQIYSRPFYEEGFANTINILNGDVYTIYVGPKGFILNDSARERARKLPVKNYK